MTAESGVSSVGDKLDLPPSYVAPTVAEVARNKAEQQEKEVVRLGSEIIGVTGRRVERAEQQGRPLSTTEKEFKRINGFVVLPLGDCPRNPADPNSKGIDFSPDDHPVLVIVGGEEKKLLAIQSVTKDKFECIFEGGDAPESVDRGQVVNSCIQAVEDVLLTGDVLGDSEKALLKLYIDSLKTGDVNLPPDNTDEGRVLPNQIFKVQEKVKEIKGAEWQEARKKEVSSDCKKLKDEVEKRMADRARLLKGEFIQKDKDSAIAVRDAKKAELAALEVALTLMPEKRAELERDIARAEARAEGKLTNEERRELVDLQENDIYAEASLRMAVGMAELPESEQGDMLVWYQYQGLRFAGTDVGTDYSDVEKRALNFDAQVLQPTLNSMNLTREQRELIKRDGIAKFILRGDMENMPDANEKLGKLFFNHDATPQDWNNLIDKTVSPKERAAIEKMLKGKKIDTWSFLSLLYVFISEGAKPLLSVSGQ